ncbi:MAG: binding-protein-dependent transport system inner rane component [Lachnospiraceae bacterium]|jgi:oligopeptide transport system permease protein|nr:binding-protein-dependent transport system inner rane component [Lachnospiraceae bacterium]
MAALRHKISKKLEDKVSDNITSMSDEELFSFQEYNVNESEKTAYSNYSYWRSTLVSFKKNKVAVFLVCIVVGILLFTFIQPFLPNQYDPNMVNNDPKTGLQYRNIAPCTKFWFGTNSIGQDLWSRIWTGTKNSLLIGITVACIEALIGIIAGVLWGYVRQLDWFFTEVYNILDNIPQTIVLILISYILKPGVTTLIFAMCLTSWIQMARFIRNQVLIIRDREYNLASRCVGTPTRRIIFKNLLPYLVSVIMLRMALSVPAAIGNEVFITYIGLGLPSDIPSLGRLINEGRELMMSASLRYQLIFPTVVVSIVTISFYIIGNAFSDAADPKNHI